MASIQNGSGSTFEAAEASRKKAFKPDNPKLAKRSQQELEKLKALGLANVNFSKKQAEEQAEIKKAKKEGRPVPVAKCTEDKRPKPDMSQSKAVRDFGDLRAKQAAFLAAKAKAAPQGPTSPVSSSGGRPGSSNLTRQSSSSPESPVQRQADLTATPSTLQAAQEVPNGKTARARLFKSGQSSPVAPASPQHARTTPEKQQPSQQQSSSQQLSEQLPEKLLQQQQQQQQSHSMAQLQQQPQAPSAAAQPQESSGTRPAQAQQQSESMQQLLRPYGPSTLRNSILEQLTQGAPTSAGWPAEVKQYFKKLLDHSVELSLEKRGLDDTLGRAEAQAQEIQEHLEYQAEQMMDLQSQLASKEDEVVAKEAELAAKDSQLSASLREAAEINEEYITELTTTQQQLESEVATLTTQLEAASNAAAHKERQEGDVQAAQKRLRAQVQALTDELESSQDGAQAREDQLQADLAESQRQVLLS
ncbi:TPA: hypothetical protein ACH3X3_012161 [Trebouxia sp. C0006]